MLHFLHGLEWVRTGLIGFGRPWTGSNGYQNSGPKIWILEKEKPCNGELGLPQPHVISCENAFLSRFSAYLIKTRTKRIKTSLPFNVSGPMRLEAGLIKGISERHILRQTILSIRFWHMKWHLIPGAIWNWFLGGFRGASPLVVSPYTPHGFQFHRQTFYSRILYICFFVLGTQRP